MICRKPPTPLGFSHHIFEANKVLLNQILSVLPHIWEVAVLIGITLFHATGFLE